MSLPERGQRRSWMDILLEVALIAVGVLLALAAGNWRESQEHEALAQRTLANFTKEMAANAGRVEKDRAYHQALAKEFADFLKRPGPVTLEQLSASVHFMGVRPVYFERTAWDLALVTQALQYLKPETALEISRVYTMQGTMQRVQDNFLQTAYLTLSSQDARVQATAVQVYLGDVNAEEPELLKMYLDELARLNKS